MPSCEERELSLLGEEIAKCIRVELSLFEVCIPADDQVTPADARVSQIAERGGDERQRRREADDQEDITPGVSLREGLEVGRERAARDVALPLTVLGYEAKAEQRGQDQIGTLERLLERLLPANVLGTVLVVGPDPDLACRSPVATSPAHIAPVASCTGARSLIVSCCASVADLPPPNRITGETQPAASHTTTQHVTTLMLISPLHHVRLDVSIPMPRASHVPPSAAITNPERGTSPMLGSPDETRCSGAIGETIAAAGIDGLRARDRGAILFGMKPSTAEVFEAALALSDDDRAKLAEKLVASLDGALDPDAETAWVVEIERRLAKIDAGQASSLSMDEAIARMHRAARAR
jgi:putative addiction module component (TIGR02574 family)